MVTNWNFAWRTAKRFVAGEKLEDAIQAIKDLNDKGINATLDHLGENTTSPAKAQKATDTAIEILEAIDHAGVSSNLSVKLTQIGLALDEELCAQNLHKIVETAMKHGTFVRIDMEDSPWVETTLNLYRRMRADCSCENLGVVIQAYMYRSANDITHLMQDQSRVRLCKGAYKEPAHVAFPKKKDVDTNFDQLTKQLVDASFASGSPHISSDGKIPPIPAIATHDDQRILFAKNYAKKIGLPEKALEFQMLHGIRRDLQEQLSSEGYPVRVYVPYGTEWYPYFTRRLAERPANVWFFISNFFRR
ncbi:MAG: proline dehydrogenase family protein [Anaerolineales bacterium]|nr:proline dehydrogenase family protein [Anaerolineales bacterium]